MYVGSETDNTLTLNQFLLSTIRELPPANAFVVGVYNGTSSRHSTTSPTSSTQLMSCPLTTSTVYNIWKRRPSTIPQSPPPPRKVNPDIKEPQFRSLEEGIHRRPTLLSHLLNPAQRPDVPPKYLSPLNVLSIFSFILALSLLALAIYEHDGIAVLALLTIALVSSIVGLASKCSPQLMNRKFRSNVPPGDVVIRLRQGALIVVHCDEEVARELYSGMEECAYTVPTIPYRILVGSGTFLLMVSVVLLGNCGSTMQLAIGISYIVLNGLFWAAALCEREYFWDLSAYEWEDATPPCAQNATRKREGDDTMEGEPSFTRTLWYAIAETRRIGWVKKGKAAPRTERWERWLQKAEEMAVKGEVGWDAVRQMNLIVGQADEKMDEAIGVRVGRKMDDVEQHAPALEVPPQERR